MRPAAKFRPARGLIHNECNTGNFDRIGVRLRESLPILLVFPVLFWPGQIFFFPTCPSLTTSPEQFKRDHAAWSKTTYHWSHLTWIWAAGNNVLAFDDNFTVWKWGNPQRFHLPPGFWPMGGLGIVPVPHLTITSPLVNRLCSSRWNYRRCQSPHKGCRLAPASKLIFREKPRLSPK